MILFNIQNHINAINAEIQLAEENLSAYGNYYTVVVNGALAVGRRDGNNGTIIGSITTGAEHFEVFTSDYAAKVVATSETERGQDARVVQIDRVLGRYISHLRASVSALEGAIHL